MLIQNLKHIPFTINIHATSLFGDINLFKTTTLPIYDSLSQEWYPVVLPMLLGMVRRGGWLTDSSSLLMMSFLAVT